MDFFYCKYDYLSLTQENIHPYETDTEKVIH